ncbi:MAG: ABC transporter substrate-binding protein [Lachnospiraceae bacterium]|nr:ABC transporter substrate-binding protein [Lachnospiraceae bacterium]
MKKRIIFLLCGMALAWNLMACQNQQPKTHDVSDYLVYSHSMDLHYAREFSVDYYEGGYALITLAGSEHYLLVPEALEVPEDLKEDVTVLEQPLKNLYLAASAAMDMFVALDALPWIRFSALKTEGWYIPEVREAMEAGAILYAGKYAAPDYERILAEDCRLAVENTMIYHTPQVKEQLERFGIPVLVDYSSYEKEPLGRMEWVRLYGLLTGRQAQAEAAFEAEKAVFEAVKGEDFTGKRVAFFYITSNGEIHVRRPSDYLPKMIELAGGCYFFQDPDEAGGSSTMTMQWEEFYAAAKDADYLIYNSTVDGEMNSLDELLAKSGLLKNFKAVQEGNVFCTSRNLYQSTMSLGTITYDIHEMLAGREENLTYLYKLE